MFISFLIKIYLKNIYFIEENVDLYTYWLFIFYPSISMHLHYPRINIFESWICLLKKSIIFKHLRNFYKYLYGWFSRLAFHSDSETLLGTINEKITFSHIELYMNIMSIIFEYSHNLRIKCFWKQNNTRWIILYNVKKFCTQIFLQNFKD